MVEDDEAPDPPSVLPAAAVEVIDELDEAELRAVIDYARKRRRYVHQDVTEKIEAGPGEEIVRVEERDGYAEVVKRLPGDENCDDSPSRTYLYHVQEEPRPEGGTHLHWIYIGEVDE